MNEQFSLDAISEVTDPSKIRVVIFINGRLVHAPLAAILKELTDQIADLEARVTALETP